MYTFSKTWTSILSVVVYSYILSGEVLELLRIMIVNIMNITFHVVVLWSDMLGAVHWRESSLSWSGPSLPSQTSGEWAQTGQAKQCCMLWGNVRMMCVGVVNGNKPLSLHGHSNTHCLSNYTRRTCRTLWGEHEQAALNHCVAKVLPVKYHNTAHWLWHVAKQGLSSLYCLQKCLSLTA